LQVQLGAFEPHWDWKLSQYNCVFTDSRSLTEWTKAYQMFLTWQLCQDSWWGPLWSYQCLCLE
jgi:hypothetical protein